MKKIVIVILILVGVISLGIGISLVFTGNKEDNNKNTNNNTNNEPANQEEIREGNVTEIKEEHCLGDLCIKDLKIINDSPQMNILSGTFVNKSDNTITGDCFKFIFEINKEVIEKNFCYGDIEAHGEAPLELQYQDPRIINATDYKLQMLTEEEKNSFLNTAS